MAPSPQLRRPRLLALVYAASLALVATTLAGVLIVTNAHIRSAALQATAAGDHVLVATFMRSTLGADELANGADPERSAAIRAALDEFATAHNLLHAVVHGSTGQPLFGTDAAVAHAALGDAILARARAGLATTTIDEPGSVLTEHLPVVDGDGALSAVVTLERDATSVLAAASAATRDVLVIFGAGAVVLAGLLLVIFRAAQQLLARRTAELVDASRRDTLTGLPNHGAVVGLLTETLEAARSSGGWVLVALVDIDGFRLLNETHGYAAGDRVLRHVAEALRATLPDGSLVGRAGPDEFLVAGPPDSAPGVRPAIDRFRALLAKSPLEFDGADDLGVTVSVGIASYPEQAGSVSELMAVAGLMLADARTGGGNRVRVHGPERGAAPERWSAFSVLEGLVEAIDGKDHYTRQHSEQVARYATLLAERLTMDSPGVEQVRLAGRLHDVGKIGVPDIILRKPGPLTDEERAVIQQHAVLGDAIVSCLPGYGEVALGIRHHHERWDGDGYPDQLHGTEIPLLARIVSLADAYSAMTTQRTYRARLTSREAMRRLAEGTGTQFDPTLTPAFIAAIEAMLEGDVAFDEEMTAGTDSLATPGSAAA